MASPCEGSPRAGAYEARDHFVDTESTKVYSSKVCVGVGGWVKSVCVHCGCWGA